MKRTIKNIIAYLNPDYIIGYYLWKYHFKKHEGKVKVQRALHKVHKKCDHCKKLNDWVWVSYYYELIK